MFWAVITRESGQRFKSLHPSPNLNLMLNVNFSALSMSELKALAATNNVTPAGDKRAKQSWISALELFAACETVSDVEIQLIGDAVEVNHENPHDSATPTVSAPNKKGAASVFGALLIAVIAMVRAVATIGVATHSLASWIYQSSKPIAQAIKSTIANRASAIAVNQPSTIMDSSLTAS
jgi:hypothetical protein